MKKILTLNIYRSKKEKDSIEATPVQMVGVYMLNPGDHFERFGGSSRGLVAGKDGSMVIRTNHLGSGSTSDYETYCYDHKSWEQITNSINHDNVSTIFHQDDADA